MAEIVQLRRDAPPADPPPAPAPAQVAIDPVCHMEVEISAAQHQHEHEGITYFFCCPGCKGRFARSPERFLAGVLG